MLRKNVLELLFCSFIFLIILQGCSRFKSPLFKKLSIEKTNIDFNNSIKELDTFNILTNEYIFNGGGVAVADFDRNGLPDLFFTGNQVENKLYLNQGKLTFKKLDSSSGIEASDKWSTGVAVGDVNGDGWVDIYVCAAMNESKRANMLFINQGTTKDGSLQFLDLAEEYGVADTSNSMAASFLDYNKDGLMDLFVVNNEQNDMLPTNYRKKIVDGSAASTDHLFRNNGDGTFSNVSLTSGIQIEGYGLSVSVSDFNNDLWPDIYITNDYLTNDILYINQQDGTFENKISEYTSCQSKFSMGSDIGDFNNDGFLDLITLDMLGETNQRKKTTISKSSHFEEELNKRWGYEKQHMRNMLFLGNNSSLPFSEIGQFSGIYQTDWSWSPLFMDVDNDGLKDLLITNGFPRDITDMDFANYRFSVGRYVSKAQLLDSIPIVKIPNYSFRNNGNLTFDVQEDSWGLNVPSFSNGAVYSDLDLDGDLDYVVNNINDPAFVFENTTNVETSNFIQFELIGPDKNLFALGSKLVLRFDDASFQLHEQYLSKGYMSSVDQIIHFGLAKGKEIAKVEVMWPDGSVTVLNDVKRNNRYTIRYDESNKNFLTEMEFPLTKKQSTPVYEEVALEYGINYVHEEKEINDFEYDRLLLRKLTKNGPCLAVGDLNGDGMEDFIVGSSTGNSPVLFYQTLQNTFREVSLFSLSKDKAYEVESIALFDLENDGDLDLYLVSGGGEFLANSTNYEDRLLINDGNGNFSIQEGFDNIYANGSVVIAEDYDLDGYVDLFVGSRNKPGSYPFGDTSYLIKNSKGSLTQLPFSENEAIGMVSDAKWVDIDGDSEKELVVVGEYTSIQIFNNEKGVLKRIKNDVLDSVKGLWRCIEVFDKNRDGDNDLIIGNIGGNNMYNISKDSPLELLALDIDKNGSIDPLIFTYQKNKQGEMVSYPIQFWNNLNQQSPYFRQRFDSYDEFSQSTKKDYLDDTIFNSAKKYSVNQDKSIVLENIGTNEFKVTELSLEAQLAPINAILVNQDSQSSEIFMVGNDSGGPPFEGDKEAMRGLVTKNNKDTEELKFKYDSSGFEVTGNAKAINEIKMKNGESLILVTLNQDSLLAFRKVKYKK